MRCFRRARSADRRVVRRGTASASTAPSGPQISGLTSSASMCRRARWPARAPPRSPWPPRRGWLAPPPDPASSLLTRRPATILAASFAETGDSTTGAVGQQLNQHPAGSGPRRAGSVPARTRCPAPTRSRPCCRTPRCSRRRTWSATSPAAATSSGATTTTPTTSDSAASSTWQCGLTRH